MLYQLSYNRESSAFRLTFDRKLYHSLFRALARRLGCGQCVQSDAQGSRSASFGLLAVPTGVDIRPPGSRRANRAPAPVGNRLIPRARPRGPASGCVVTHRVALPCPLSDRAVLWCASGDRSALHRAARCTTDHEGTPRRHSMGPFGRAHVVGASSASPARGAEPGSRHWEPAAGSQGAGDRESRWRVRESWGRSGEAEPGAGGAELASGVRVRYGFQVERRD